MCASMWTERRSLPSAPDRGSPCDRDRWRHRLTLAALTPNRAAATAAKTRFRRSKESAFAISAGLLVRSKTGCCLDPVDELD